MQGKQNAKAFYSNHIYATLLNKISLISPLIIFPLLAMYLHSWWILLGILFTYIGGMFFNKPTFAIIILVVTIFYSFKYGFTLHNLCLIFFLSYLYGYITVTISRYFLNRVEKNKMKMQDAVDKEMSKLFKQPLK